jgi:hypothetical protein
VEVYCSRDVARPVVFGPSGVHQEGPDVMIPFEGGQLPGTDETVSGGLGLGRHLLPGEHPRPLVPVQPPQTPAKSINKMATPRNMITVMTPGPDLRR